MKLPEITKRRRLIGLLVVLVLQTALFFVFLPRPPAVLSDNARYEYAGWALSTGRGLSLPFSMSPDPDVRSWVCTRHPDACVGDLYPTAQYPAGYQVFVAAIYTVFGRSLWALAVANLALLWVLFACAERLAFTSLGRRGYWFVMAIAATYPFIARQAAVITSDHLHTVLLLGAITAIATMRPSWKTFVLFGALLGGATFVRTYSIVCLPFVFGWPRLRRAFGASGKQWATAAAVCLLPFVIWTARNAYWYGRFIPFSTTGLGLMLYTNKVEAELGEVYNPETKALARQALFGWGEDPSNYTLNRRITREALDWMKAHPGTVARQVVMRIPRVWVSKGSEGEGVSRAYPLLVLYLGGLLVLGVGGMWLKRRDAKMNLVAVIIVLYWGFLLHTGAEARRTLPLRLPMLIFAGFAVEAGAARLLRKKDERTASAEATSRLATGAD